MSNLPIVEMIAVLTMAVSVPSLAMAIWHGWKFEERKADQQIAATEEER